MPGGEPEETVSPQPAGPGAAAGHGGVARAFIPATGVEARALATIEKPRLTFTASVPTRLIEDRIQAQDGSRGSVSELGLACLLGQAR